MTAHEQYDREYDAADRETRRIDKVAVARVTGTAHSIEDGPKPGTVVITTACLHALIRAGDRRFL